MCRSFVEPLACGNGQNSAVSRPGQGFDEIASGLEHAVWAGGNTTANGHAASMGAFNSFADEPMSLRPPRIGSRANPTGG